MLKAVILAQILPDLIFSKEGIYKGINQEEQCVKFEAKCRKNTIVTASQMLVNWGNTLMGMF